MSASRFAAGRWRTEQWESLQVIEQPVRLPQAGRSEAFRETAINRFEKSAGPGPIALVQRQAGEACRSSKLQGFRPMSAIPSHTKVDW